MESAKCLGAVDDFCQFLIATGQQERAAIVLKGSLEAKISLCGDLSPEVAETYWLRGGTELAQGHTHLAYKKLKKMLVMKGILLPLCPSKQKFLSGFIFLISNNHCYKEFLIAVK
uniref:Uncharacterized protein n=1 Tax=Chrysemys picta bellii TaxID=8478 RepID=A0A8C3I2V7_CHRPI